MKTKNEQVEKNEKTMQNVMAEEKAVDNNLTIEQVEEKIREMLTPLAEQMENFSKLITAMNERDENDDTLDYVRTERFFKNADSKELDDEYERLTGMDEAKLSRADKMKLDGIKNKKNYDSYKSEMNLAKEWFTKEYGNGFYDMVLTDEFQNYLASADEDLLTAVKNYAKKTIKPKSIGTGSVKNSGSAIGKDFISREEVEKMSPEEIRKNYSLIRKSMPKWK